MKNLETGLPYARLDGVHNSIRHHRKESGWQGAYIWCLRHRDFESAEIIRQVNAPKPNEQAMVLYDPRFHKFDYTTVADAMHQVVMNELRALGRSQVEFQTTIRALAAAAASW